MLGIMADGESECKDVTGSRTPEKDDDFCFITNDINEDDTKELGKEPEFGSSNTDNMSSLLQQAQTEETEKENASVGSKVQRPSDTESGMNLADTKAAKHASHTNVDTSSRRKYKDFNLVKISGQKWLIKVDGVKTAIPDSIDIDTDSELSYEDDDQLSLKSCDGNVYTVEAEDGKVIFNKKIEKVVVPGSSSDIADSEETRMTTKRGADSDYTLKPKPRERSPRVNPAIPPSGGTPNVNFNEAGNETDHLKSYSGVQERTSEVMKAGEETDKIVSGDDVDGTESEKVAKKVNDSKSCEIQLGADHDEQNLKGKLYGTSDKGVKGSFEESIEDFTETFAQMSIRDVKVKHLDKEERSENETDRELGDSFTQKEPYDAVDKLITDETDREHLDYGYSELQKTQSHRIEKLNKNSQDTHIFCTGHPDNFTGSQRKPDKTATNSGDNNACATNEETLVPKVNGEGKVGDDGMVRKVLSSQKSTDTQSSVSTSSGADAEPSSPEMKGKPNLQKEAGEANNIDTDSQAVNTVSNFREADKESQDKIECHFDIQPLIMRILHDENTRKGLENRFPNVAYKLKKKDRQFVCLLEGISYDDCEKAKLYILNLLEGHGYVEFGFSDIRNFDKLKNKNQILKVCLSEISDDSVNFICDKERSKITISAETQNAADRVSASIKRCLCCKEDNLPPGTDITTYLQLTHKIIEEKFKNKIEINVNEEVMKMQFVGLKRVIDTAVETLKPISKWYEITCGDYYKLIVQKVEQKAENKLEVSPAQVQGKQGINIKGISLYVGEMIQYIRKLEKEINSEMVRVASKAQAKYLDNNAGKDFIEAMQRTHDVQIDEEDAGADEDTDEGFEEFQYNLPEGHQINLTTRNIDNLQTDIKVWIKAKDGKGTAEMKPNSFHLYIPAKSEARRKDDFHVPVNHMLKAIVDKRYLQVSVFLQEVGGWSFKEVVKNVLYPIRTSLTADMVPMIWTFCVPGIKHYNEAMKVFEHYLSTEEGNAALFTADDDSKLNVSIVEGSLSDQQADVLVNTTSHSLNLNDGVVSAHLMAKAGQDLQKECNEYTKGGRTLQAWRFVETKGYGLHCKVVLHGVLAKKRNSEDIKNLQEFVYRCLVKCNELKMTSIAFPALGTGQLGFSAREVAVAMFEAARYFEMKVRHPFLNQMYVVIYDSGKAILKDFQDVQLMQKDSQTEGIKVGKIPVLLRNVDIRAIKADTVIYFLEMNAFRKGRWSSSTIKTTGGDLMASRIIHIPYVDCVEKMRSAFQEAFNYQAGTDDDVCTVFFNKGHPMLKYTDTIPSCVVSTLKQPEISKSSLKSLVIVVEGKEDYKKLQKLFDIQPKEGLAKGAQEPEGSTQLLVERESRAKALIITGLKDNVQEAKRQIVEKLAELKPEKTVAKPLPVEPPTTQEISKEVRGYLDKHDGVDEKLKPSDYSPSATDERSEYQAQEGRERKKLPEYIKEMALKESASSRLEAPKESWSSSNMVTDPEESRCVEVELPASKEDETWENLMLNIFKPPFPVPPPTLIYPFECRNKALLVCQDEKDADKLANFKAGKYLYKKLKPQCVQKCQMNLPSAYVKTLKDKNKFDMCKKKLVQMGLVEINDTHEDNVVAVTAFSLAQIQMITEFLQSLEDMSDVSSASSDTSEKDTTETVTVEKVLDVSRTAWTVIKVTLSEQMSALDRQNIYVHYDDKEGCIILDGDINEVNVGEFTDAVNDLKVQQMEEIKPTKVESYKNEFQQWNSDIVTTIGHNCCVYYREANVFIAFGKSYDDILKVKHQLGIKQGLVKQTGRRRNRNLDTTASPVMPVFDSGPQSLPSMPSSSEFFSPPARHVSAFDWNVDAREVQRYRTDEGIKVFVYIANILKLPVDCIVNAANDNLQHGGGVALVIARAAGWKLKTEGDDYVRTKGRIPVGMACTTTAGNLPYDCVIHAVGPRWADYSPHSLKDVQRCEVLLKGAILSSFFKAEERGLKSIALPAISSAIFAVPEKMCAVQYANAVLSYSKDSVKSTKKVLAEFHFVDKNPEIVRLIQKTFQTMITEKKTTDYDVNDYVRVNTSTVYHNPNWEQKKGQRGERQNRQFGAVQRPVKIDADAFICIEKGDGLEILSPNQNQQVLLYKGDILNVRHVTAVICSEDEYGNGRGGIAKGLLEKAGNFGYKDKKRQEFWNGKTLGDVVVTGGEGTGFQYVFHAVISSSYSARNQKEVIETAYKKILAQCQKRVIYMKSIALPVLGTGAAKLVSVQESVEAFILALHDFCSRSPGKDKKLTIHLVCWTDKEKEEVTAILKSLFQKDEPTSKDYGSVKDDKTAEEKDSPPPSAGTDESCVICQDNITDPKMLPCGHVFCKGCIDHYLDNYKQVCPTCGKVCGIITGDQPYGTMTERLQDYFHCAGYEDCGRIDITYYFPGGKQGSSHPNPGKHYQGITRTAYLPDNKEGREILELLKVAFDRKLIFTIGRSRTTGKEDVITWNDIHHKTNPRPNQNFGYPDPEYFGRVKDELAAKGVTVKDIPELSAGREAGGYRHHKF